MPQADAFPEEEMFVKAMLVMWRMSVMCVGCLLLIFKQASIQNNLSANKFCKLIAVD